MGLATEICERGDGMNKRGIKNLVNRLSDLIDKCDNDFEAMVFNPDATFDLLCESHYELSEVLREWW